MLLDADNIPLRDPTPLFDSKEYRDYGLIMWPDFWGLSFDPQVTALICTLTWTFSFDLIA